MKVNAALGIALGLALTQPAPSGAQEPKAAIKPAAADPAAACTKAVDALVAQLRRYPPRPSRAAGQSSIYLIDSKGGEATVIGSEPDPWLIYCDWPSWSADGKTIIFGTRRDPFSNFDVRLKALDLNLGRLEIRDLGLGGWPSIAPTCDRILASLMTQNPRKGELSGLWLMDLEGSKRTFIGGGPMTRWSSKLDKFMVADQNAATIVDVRPERSGAVVIPGRPMISPPSWAGEDRIVAAVAGPDGESIVLANVANPGQAELTEVLWRRQNGPDVHPDCPTYSPASGRCVFVGGQQNNRGQNQALALYGFTKGQTDPPERLETGPLDQILEDVALSPDGRYVLFGSNRNIPGRSPTMRAQSVAAPALTGITIDGDLKDWPAAMPRHPLQNLAEDSAREFEDKVDHPSRSTSRDLSAAFSVGYSPKEQLLYVAIVVQDDSLVIGDSSPFDTDAVELYLDGRHSEATLQQRPQAGWDRTIDASEPPVLHYAGKPGKGRVYGITESAGEKRDVENPILFYGDIKQTKTRMAFRRVGDVTTYEWAIQVFDQYPDQPTQLGPGVSIGFDIDVRDKDAPNPNDPGGAMPLQQRSTLLCWSARPMGVIKVFGPASLGEIILGR